jgi:hypothetical protein
MPRLTEEGQRNVADVAQRHGVSVDAATHLLLAVSAGHGTQAQFNHPELGGMGQWTQGGMTMVGDMFNNSLKAQVDSLCTDLSDIVRNHSLLSAPSSSQSQSQGAGLGVSGVSLFVEEADWPAELGQPASVGSQNDVRYAYFPDKRRLAIRVGGRTKVYDTGEHRIGGFGQAQAGGQSLSFTSQHGLVRIADLALVSDGSEGPSGSAEQSATAAPAFPAPTPQPAPPSEAPQAMTDDQIFSRIERLAELFEKGILREAEYEAKKAELLARL